MSLRRIGLHVVLTPIPSCSAVYTSRMPQDVLSEAREQAKRSAPAVKTAALLQLARVSASVDPPRRSTSQTLIEWHSFLGARFNGGGLSLPAHATRQLTFPPLPIFNTRNRPPRG